MTTAALKWLVVRKDFKKLKANWETYDFYNDYVDQRLEVSWEHTTIVLDLVSTISQAVQNNLLGVPTIYKFSNIQTTLRTISLNFFKNHLISKCFLHYHHWRNRYSSATKNLMLLYHILSNFLWSLFVSKNILRH